MKSTIINLTILEEEVLKLSRGNYQLIGTPQRPLTVYGEGDIILNNVEVDHPLSIHANGEISLANIIGKNQDGNLYLEAPRICCPRINYPHVNVTVSSSNQTDTYDLSTLKGSYITVEGETIKVEHLIPQKPVQFQKKGSYRS